MTEYGTIALLREQHEAMGDVMALRRLSASPAQRAKAESAIAVWRRVETFLAEHDATFQHEKGCGDCFRDERGPICTMNCSPRDVTRQVRV